MSREGAFAPSVCIWYNKRMRNIKYTKLIFIICSLLVAILIFSFSAQTAEVSKEGSRFLTDFVVKLVEPDYDKLDLLTQQAIYGKVHHLIRKTAHFVEFAALSFFISLSIRKYWGILICIAYAALDEIHQMFTLGRSCEIKDIIIDSFGAVFGALCCFLLLWAMKKKWFKQIKNFLLVGFSVFLIDYILLYILTDIAGIWYLLSATISFIVSTIYNYFMSMRFVFKGRDDRSKKNEFTIFFILNLIGLGINTLCMYVFVSKLKMHYMIAKILVTGIVMVWSFISRKLFIEKH